MPRSPHPTVDTRQIPGKDLELPLVVALGTVHSRSAERVVWHTHGAHELLFVLEGATSYEFHPDRTVELTGGHFLFVPAGSQHRGGQDVRMPSVLCGIQFDARRRNAGRHSVLTCEDLRHASGAIGRRAADGSAVPSGAAPGYPADDGRMPGVQCGAGGLRDQGQPASPGVSGDFGGGATTGFAGPGGSDGNGGRRGSLPARTSRGAGAHVRLCPGTLA